MGSPVNATRTPASAKPSSLSGLFISVFLLGLSALLWPGLAEREFSLDWRLGNMRPVFYGLAAVLGLAALAAWLARRRIGVLVEKVFPSRRHLLFALVTAALAFLMSLLAIELGLRLTGQPFRMTTSAAENAVAQFDPELGWTYIPNRSIVQRFGAEGREVAIHFDDIASRVRAPGVRRNPAKPSVLFVGDSFTMGHGVTYEESFVGRLEAMPDFPFQTVNLGVQGYGTDQSLLMLERHFTRFPTRAVVYTFIDDHVNRNENYDRRVIFPGVRFLGTKPLFGLRPDGTLYLRKPAVRLENLRYSRVAALVEIALYRYGPKPTDKLTRALVEEMRRYVESRGGVLIVLDWNMFWKKRGAPILGRDSFFRGMNLHLVDTGIDAPGGWNDWYIPKDGHPDARAHAHVAGLLHNALAEWVSR